LGARSINWVHIFPWGVKWCEVQFVLTTRNAEGEQDLLSVTWAILW